MKKGRVKMMNFRKMFRYLDSEEIAELIRKGEADLNDLPSMAPFMEEQEVDQLAGEYYHLTGKYKSILPFMSEEGVAQLAKAVSETGEDIRGMLPFLDEDDIADFPDEMFEDPNLRRAILPFCDEETAARICRIAMESGEDDLSGYMPFMDEDDVDDLFVEMALNGINDHRCYPFVSEEGFGRVLDLYLKGEIDFDFDDAYPFMDDDDIRRLFRNEIRKRKEQ